MSLLDPGIEDPKAKRRRYVVSAIALALLLAAGVGYLLRYSREKRTVESFMNAVLAGDMQQGYQIWKPRANFTMKDFEAFWGPKGYYSPIKSYKIEKAVMPPDGSSGVIVIVEISGEASFPSSDDVIKTAQLREARIWVERSDQSLSFPPP